MSRLAAGALTGVLALAALAACAEEPGAEGGGDGAGTVAFLMPDLASTRYEQHDAPSSRSAWQSCAPTAR
nr:hypothetical protein GCM10025732_58160 [Glycomyces mayteni]